MRYYWYSVSYVYMHFFGDAQILLTHLYGIHVCLGIKSWFRGIGAIARAFPQEALAKPWLVQQLGGPLVGEVSCCSISWLHQMNFPKFEMEPPNIGISSKCGSPFSEFIFPSSGVPSEISGTKKGFAPFIFQCDGVQISFEALAV